MTADTPSTPTTTVLVTGISGFLAGHIALQLLTQGYSVRGTLRDMGRQAQVRDQLICSSRSGTLSFVQADLNADLNWDRATDGCDYVIHAASPFPSLAPKDEADLIRPARDGALRVLRAAHRAGVSRVVLTSSVAATNHGKGRAPYTENDWTDVNSPRATPYYKSKTLAEQAAWSYARESGLELTVVNPGMILGPLLGPECGASVGLVYQLLQGKFKALPQFACSVVDVRDAAQAHIQAMTCTKAAGQRFIVGGRVLSMWDIRTILLESFPQFAHRLPHRIAPNWLVRLLAVFDPHARQIVHELGRDLRVNSDKARQILQWQPRSVEEAVRASAQSLIAQGLVCAS